MSASIASGRFFRRSVARRQPGRSRLAETLHLYELASSLRPGTVLLGGLVILILVLFRLSLFQGWTFIGDSDRLNTVLAVRLFEVDQIQARGSVPTWTDQQFMGSPLAGLHWMLPGFTPLPYLLALLPTTELYRALGVFAALLLGLAIVSAYVALRPYSAGPIPAAAGALVYGLSSYVVMRIAQLDVSFGLLIVVPQLLAEIRRARRQNAARSFLWLVLGLSALILLTFLQEVAYVAFLIGAYALFRAVRLRDPWPVLVLGVAFAMAVVVGLPRIITVGQDVAELQRTSTNVQTDAVESLRFFGDGLLGRFYRENTRTLRGDLNMHEGVQMLGSALAAFDVIAVGLLSRSWGMRLLGVTLVVLLSVALVDYNRPFYDLGLGREGWPSYPLRALFLNVDLIGLPLWLICAWLAARSSRRLADPRSRSSWTAFDETPAARIDTVFFLGLVVVILALILIPEAHDLLYYAFFRVDFTHSRLCVAAILPLAALTTIFLSRFLPARFGRSSFRWVAAGLGLGIVLWLAREQAAAATVAAAGSVLDLRPSRLLTIEAVRVLSSLLALLLAAAVLVFQPRRTALIVTGGALVAWVSLEAYTSADYKLSGPQTQSQTIPFDGSNLMQAAPGQLRPPTPVEREPIRDRLEADDYRSIMYQDRDRFPAMVEPHLAAFWNLRLLEGYSTGLPRRLAMLPWAASMYNPHTLDIYTTHAIKDMPWHLLAALNVKYLVYVDRSLWFNPAPGLADPPADPDRLRIVENPVPAAPRAFFAARVSPAGPVPLLPGDDGVRPAPKDVEIEDPTLHSVAEGLPAEREFITEGTISPIFDGDRVLVKVNVSSAPRFLVLNELYHPSWRAWVNGKPAEIYPTNLVMRGILVPPGATTIELRYEPFLASWYGLAIFAGGLLLAGCAWLAFRRWTGSPDVRPSRGWTAPSPERLAVPTHRRGADLAGAGAGPRRS